MSGEKEFVQQLQQRADEEKKQRMDMQRNIAATNFQKEEQENVVKWILDIEEDMQTIEHLLRGDVPKRTADGNEYWESCPEDEKVMSDRGVRECLKIIRGYLTKNVFLSNFSEEDIKLRCFQFGTRLNNFFRNNYEIFGWTTPEKRKHYEIVFGWLLDMVEAAYYRALNGFTLKSIGTKILVTQSIDDNHNSPYPQQKKFTDKFKKLFQ